MTSKRTLAVVPDGATVSPKKPLTILEAAELGDSLQLLMALRTRLASTVQNEATPPRDLAALSKRLTDVDDAIKARQSRDREEAQSGAAPDESFDAAAI